MHAKTKTRIYGLLVLHRADFDDVWLGYFCIDLLISVSSANTLVIAVKRPVTSNGFIRTQLCSTSQQMKTNTTWQVNFNIDPYCALRNANHSPVQIIGEFHMIAEYQV